VLTLFCQWFGMLIICNEKDRFDYLSLVGLVILLQEKTDEKLKVINPINNDIYLEQII
jgi:hypothetical protein